MPSTFLKISAPGRCLWSFLFTAAGYIRRYDGPKRSQEPAQALDGDCRARKDRCCLPGRAKRRLRKTDMERLQGRCHGQLRGGRYEVFDNSYRRGCAKVSGREKKGLRFRHLQRRFHGAEARCGGSRKVCGGSGDSRRYPSAGRRRFPSLYSL